MKILNLLIEQLDHNVNFFRNHPFGWRGLWCCGGGRDYGSRRKGRIRRNVEGNQSSRETSEGTTSQRCSQRCQPRCWKLRGKIWPSNFDISRTQKIYSNLVTENWALTASRDFCWLKLIQRTLLFRPLTWTKGKVHPTTINCGWNWLSTWTRPSGRYSWMRMTRWNWGDEEDQRFHAGSHDHCQCRLRHIRDPNWSRCYRVSNSFLLHWPCPIHLTCQRSLVLRLGISAQFLWILG